ncbi:hypothetical protein PRIPAC_88872 [Pristionchus pacificus]|uniref:Apple domain-containing protein n=1 Tax=Pristionchus pacificus TaxID=54126 RepID=A0A454XRJ9_PRIPA|nr:hypothetical protein PRIPAC_88872 [Pristionchus pacificus]|eukprot:PDM62008.1 hypothetical protein PRIPAC_51450 [Pristionchus pacificus]
MACFTAAAVNAHRPLVADITPAASLSQCQDLCAQNSQCAAVVFAATTLMCALFGTPSGLLSCKHASTVVMWEKGICETTTTMGSTVPPTITTTSDTSTSTTEQSTTTSSDATTSVTTSDTSSLTTDKSTTSTSSTTTTTPTTTTTAERIGNYFYCDNGACAGFDDLTESGTAITNGYIKDGDCQLDCDVGTLQVEIGGEWKDVLNGALACATGSWCGSDLPSTSYDIGNGERGIYTRCKGSSPEPKSAVNTANCSILDQSLID